MVVKLYMHNYISPTARYIINIQLPKALKTGCPSCNRTTIDNCSMSSLSLLTASYSSWSKLCTFTNTIWWTRPPWNHGTRVRVFLSTAQDEAIFPAAQETSCLCFNYNDYYNNNYLIIFEFVFRFFCFRDLISITLRSRSRDPTISSSGERRREAPMRWTILIGVWLSRCPFEEKRHLK